MPGQIIYVRPRRNHLLEKAENGALTFVERQLESLSLILKGLTQDKLPAQNAMASLPCGNHAQLCPQCSSMLVERALKTLSINLATLSIMGSKRFVSPEEHFEQSTKGHG